MPAAPRPVPPILRQLPSPALARRDRLVEALSKAISDDALPAELPLPSCRALARVHRVSKNTVQAAYERLVDLGFVSVRQRSGYFVALAPKGRHALSPEIHRARTIKLPEPRPSSMPRVRHAENWRDHPFPFIYNQIDPDLFPIDAWRECSRLALGRKDMPNWTADDESGDNPNLTAQLRKRLVAQRGIHAAEDEIMVTLGTQNAIALVGLLLRDVPGVIAVEDPGYPDARNTFALTGNSVVPVPVDHRGLCVDRLPRGCKLVYVTPSHQFPTGVTLASERREALLEAAERQDFLILEDDYEADLETETAERTLRSLDRQDQVLHASSLSKSLSPALRIGYLIGAPGLIREAKALRHAVLRHAPTMIQETTALFIGLGHYDAHLRRLTREMGRRREAMRAGIATNLHRFASSDPRGGSSFWLSGPMGFDSDALSRQLAMSGVILDPGRIFHFDRNRASDFRLGFGAIKPERIELGLKLIGDAVGHSAS